MQQGGSVRGSSAHHTDANSRRAARGAKPPGRAPWQPIIEVIAIGSTIILMAIHAHRSWDALARTGAWWMLPLAMGIGILMAYFGSGVVHRIGDRFFREDSPVIGTMLIHPFREHHRDPRGITRHSLLELHGNTGLAITGALGLVLLLAPTMLQHPVQLILELAVFFFLAAAFATNQLHMWTHMDRPPAFARWLQRGRLVLTKDAHALHTQTISRPATASRRAG